MYCWCSGVLPPSLSLFLFLYFFFLFFSSFHSFLSRSLLVSSHGKTSNYCSQLDEQRNISCRNLNGTLLPLLKERLLPTQRLNSIFRCDVRSNMDMERGIPNLFHHTHRDDVNKSAPLFKFTSVSYELRVFPWGRVHGSHQQRQLHEIFLFLYLNSEYTPVITSPMTREIATQSTLSSLPLIHIIRT